MDIITQTVAKWLIGTIGTCIIALVVFYFNTTYVLAQNVKDTAKVTSQVGRLYSELATIKLTPKLNAEKIRNIEKDIKELKDGQEKIIDLLVKIHIEN